jgi:hypothetical protein
VSLDSLESLFLSIKRFLRIKEQEREPRTERSFVTHLTHQSNKHKEPHNRIVVRDLNGTHSLNNQLLVDLQKVMECRRLMDHPGLSKQGKKFKAPRFSGGQFYPWLNQPTWFRQSR